MSTKRKIAAIAQLRSTSNKVENLTKVAECARLAKGKGASMLFLPECFGFIGESSEQTLAHAEEESALTTEDPLNEKYFTAYLRLACSEKSSKPFQQEAPSIDDASISILDGLRTIAKETALWISGGGMHIGGAPVDRETGNPRVYNTHVIIDSNGSLKAIYRKIHLFDVSIPGKVQLRESATTAPGTALVVCDSPLGRFSNLASFQINSFGRHVSF
jgi:predicted amidohydrolase